MITQMKDSGVEGYVQMGGYPIDAVPYAMFARLIGRKESSVKAMIVDLPLYFQTPVIT
ncbi:hypothetical protein ESCOCP334M_24685 [Escherichia coli]